MTKFQGFATLEEAKEYQKKNGGLLCGKESKTKLGKEYYNQTVIFGGLDEIKYPWALQWSGK
jgi:hypothetical protein